MEIAQAQVHMISQICYSILIEGVVPQHVAVVYLFFFGVYSIHHIMAIYTTSNALWTWKPIRRILA